MISDGGSDWEKMANAGSRLKHWSASVCGVGGGGGGVCEGHNHVCISSECRKSDA